MKSRHRMSEKEFEETFPRHYQRWTKEEERKVIETLHNMEPIDSTRWYDTMPLVKLSRKVGRTTGSLMARFGWHRLMVEFQYGLLKRGRHVDFIRSLQQGYSISQEWRRKLGKIDNLLDENLEIEKVKDRLKGTYKDKWEPNRWYSKRYDLLIDEENNNESS